MNAVGELLHQMAPPRLPRDAIGGRFGFTSRGDLIYPRRSRTGSRRDDWLRESAEERSSRYAEYHGTQSRLGFMGNDADLRAQFRAVLEPLKWIEGIIMSSPLEHSARETLLCTRDRLEERLSVLRVARETNSEVASLLQAELMAKGPNKTFGKVLQRYMQKRGSSNRGGNGGGFRGRGRGNFSGYGGSAGGVFASGGAHGNAFGPQTGFGGFQSGFGSGPSGGGGGFGGSRPNTGEFSRNMRGKCYRCGEPGHRIEQCKNPPK